MNFFFFVFFLNLALTARRELMPAQTKRRGDALERVAKRLRVERPHPIREVTLSSLLATLGGMVNKRFPLPEVLVTSLTTDLLGLTLKEPAMALPVGGATLELDYQEGKLLRIIASTNETDPADLFQAICREMHSLGRDAAPAECLRPWSKQTVQEVRLTRSLHIGDIPREYLMMMWKVTIELLNDPSDNRKNWFSLISNPEYAEILKQMEPKHVFTLGPEIASGGFGKVHLSTMDGERFATKVINLPDNQYNLAMIHNEIKVLKAMRGAINVVQIHRAQLNSMSQAAIVMEYLEGMEGLNYINNLKSEDVNFALLGAIFREILVGLQEIHDRGYIHSDLKWENVHLGSDGRVTIMDMGLAVRHEHLIIGSTEYYAPEEYWDPSYLATEDFDIGQVGEMVATILKLPFGMTREAVDALNYVQLDPDGEFTPEMRSMIKFMQSCRINKLSADSLLQSDFIQNGCSQEQISELLHY